ncbi:MAG: heat shock protein transcriptional repressor HspR [Actinomycetota bacterium]
MARRKQETAVYVISVAAELGGVHPQTLRMYERKGLLSPQRTSGNTRRYSAEDIQRLRRIQELTQGAGVNLAGAKLVLRLEEQLGRMRRELNAMASRLEELEADVARDMRRIVRQAGEIVPARDYRSLNEMWNEHRRRSTDRPIELGPPHTGG